MVVFTAAAVAAVASSLALARARLIAAARRAREWVRRTRMIYGEGGYQGNETEDEKRVVERYQVDSVGAELLLYSSAAFEPLRDQSNRDHSKYSEAAEL